MPKDKKEHHHKVSKWIRSKRNKRLLLKFKLALKSLQIELSFTFFKQSV